MNNLTALRKEIKKQSSPKRAESSKSFFKTGKGQYGEGDVFVGLTSAQSREVARKFRDLNLPEIKKLLQSKIHEERLVSLLILVEKFEKGSEGQKEEIFKFYLNNAKFVNNWDLVDTSAHQIAGKFMLKRPKQILNKLARSKNLWERRIAIVSTYQFIKNRQFAKTLEIAIILLKDKHDLIHKAVGWMLREVGKRDEKTLVRFLDKYRHCMPRTALRYAIERFPENRRKAYLAR